MKRAPYLITLLIALTLICGLHIANVQAKNTEFLTYQIFVKTDSNITFYAFAPTQAQFNLLIAQAKMQGIPDSAMWIWDMLFDFYATDSTDTNYVYKYYTTDGLADSTVTFETDAYNRVYWGNKLDGYTPVFE